MQFLKTQVKNYLLKEKDERKEKNSFWCTEAETNQFEIFHRFKGTPESNPMTVETVFALDMRKKLEEAVVDIFKKMGILVDPKPYKDKDGNLIENPDQHRVEMEREGVKITGYMDAVIKEEGVNIPVEIKTSYGPYAEKELKMALPKMGYLKQLGQYMDFMGVNKGYLFQVHFQRDLIIDDIYQFTLIRNGDEFTCGSQKFNISEIYKRYAKIWNEYISKNIQPPSDYIYKYPIEQIKWREQPKSKISNARNNKAVIGDWQVIYSAYKDLIIQLENETPGYTDKELEYIKEQTSGYTTWK